MPERLAPLKVQSRQSSEDKKRQALPQEELPLPSFEVRNKGGFTVTSLDGRPKIAATEAGRRDCSLCRGSYENSQGNVNSKNGPGGERSGKKRVPNPAFFPRFTWEKVQPGRLTFTTTGHSIPQPQRYGEPLRGGGFGETAVGPVDPKQLSRYFALAQVGLEMAVPIAGGWVLDLVLDTTPWGIVGGAILGLVGGMAHLIALANRKNDSPPKPGPPKSSTP